jgi:hypothetical protein
MSRRYRWYSNQRGQSLVESAIVLVLMSFILFGMLQVVVKINAEQVQQWAVFASARARIVGYGDGGVQKMFLVGNILNSGPMIAPQSGLSAVTQSSIELDQISTYLGPGPVYGSDELEYQRWDQFPTATPASATDQHVASAEQDFPLEIAGLIPMLSASFGGSNMVLQTEVTLENHFPLYLNY